MASGGWRVHPIEEMEATGAAAAVSSSSYGGISMNLMKKEKERAENASSMEQAYWSGMRRRMGLHTKENENNSEVRQYEQFQRNMATYVEQNFQQKECIKFVPKPGQKVDMNRKLKCHCGEVAASHGWNHFANHGVKFVHEEFYDLVRNPTTRPPEEIPKVEWDPEKYIDSRPSWSYGKINFNIDSSSGRKPAKYLRLSNKDSVDSCLEYIRVFWHIMEPTPPNLVISVVGGAKNFRLDGEMRDTFANGLIKAAKTTNVWLITSGFNMGVMKAVGQAVNEGQAFVWDNDRMRHLLRCIAIAPWGYVYGRKFLEARNRKGRVARPAYYRSSNRILHGQPVSLNPDHTHFIFVDDGYRNRYGGVADFRARFERKLCTPKRENGYGIPVVMLVVEGGPDAIQDACQSLKEGIPVVVCTGTGRAADFLTYAHKFTIKDRNGKCTMNERQRQTLQERVLKAYSKNWGNNADAELEKVMTRIDECMERDHLMIFFNLRNEEDLDLAILSVLTKAETTSAAKQLELALTWNRADIAQTEIFREDVNWDDNDLYRVMTKALLEDKMNFVRLLLNQGVSMKDYLEVWRLEDLYNSIPKHGYLHLILKRHLHKEQFTHQDICRFLTSLLDRYEDKIRLPTSVKNRQSSFRKGTDNTDTDADEEPSRFKTPYKPLMVWAVLMNRMELAKFFWEMGEEPIASALSASMLCAQMHRHVPKHTHSVRQDFLNMKKMFEELATKVLDECHAVDPEKSIVLVERKSPSWSKATCLQIAAAANDQQFVSSVACQTSVTNVWKNGILSEWKRFILFPSTTIWGKVRDWFSWINRVDTANMLLAFIGLALRSSSEYYMAAKTVYCVNAVVFYIRIMKVYIANSHLGPKLYMIFRMVEELVMFVVVLGVFLLAYGVCSQGLLYKRRQASFEVFKDIIQFPYWQLYGEIFLEEIQTDTDCLALLGNGTAVPDYENTCRESYWLVYIMLGLYLLVGNVLLLNLLIAIFSHVFTMVQQNSIEIWKYQMYFLVMEFQCKVRLPPPLSIFQHIYFLLLFIVRKTCCKKKKSSEQFSKHHLAYLALFEKEMMANYLRRMKVKSMDSMSRKFTKLQKRVDMLSKVIEERHVEDELAMQASLRLGDGLRVMSAVANHQPSKAESPRTLKSSAMGPLAELLGTGPADSKEDEEEKKDKEENELGAPQMEKKSEKPEREYRVAFSLDKEPREEAPEEEKKKKHRKKKKKRDKSKERDSSVEKKELNINMSEIHTKPVPEKHISDENNDLSESARTLPRLRSKSPTDTGVFFTRPPPSILRAPKQSAPTLGLHTLEASDEPDGESDVASESAVPRSPKHLRSRGRLNMLSQVDQKLVQEEEESDLSSDNSFRLHRKPPHHRPRKSNQRKPPRLEHEGSDSG